MEPSVSGVGVIDKAVRVLDALEAGPLALSELVDASRLSRATAYRLAVALEAHGLVRRDDEGRFVLGVRLVELGRAAADAIPLAAAAEVALAELRDATGESVQLYVRDGDRRVCIAALGVAARAEDDRADGRQPPPRRRVRRPRAHGPESHRHGFGDETAPMGRKCR